MGTNTVKDAMAPTPTTVEADETAVDAARLMAAESFGSLPVVEGEELVGIVTDRDLVLHVLERPRSAQGGPRDGLHGESGSRRP